MTNAISSDQNASLPSDLVGELQNFEDISRFLNLSPGAIPRLPGVDIHGFSMPLRGGIGGDHILYIDFNEHFDLAARIRDADVRVATPSCGNFADAGSERAFCWRTSQDIG